MLRRETLGATLAGLQEMLMYGLKGMAAYTHHAGEAGRRGERRPGQGRKRGRGGKGEEERGLKEKQHPALHTPCRLHGSL